MTKELTFGEKAVSWNTKGYSNPQVGDVKAMYAEIIDTMNALRNGTDSPDVKRLASTAITQAEIASMCAVKAITWNQ